MQTIVLYLCYIVLILLFSTAYNTSLIYCFVIWCLHTNKRRPCSSTLSGHPSSSAIWHSIFTIIHIHIMQVFQKRLFFQKSSLRIFNKPHSWFEIINYWVVDLTRLILREVVSQPSYLWELLLDTSSQISHMFWGMLSFWCKSQWHDALDWDWDSFGESLFLQGRLCRVPTIIRQKDR